MLSNLPAPAEGRHREYLLCGLKVAGRNYPHGCSTGECKTCQLPVVVSSIMTQRIMQDRRLSVMIELLCIECGGSDGRRHLPSDAEGRTLIIYPDNRLLGDFQAEYRRGFGSIPTTQVLLSAIEARLDAAMGKNEWAWKIPSEGG